MTFAPRLLILLAIASLLATACGEDSDNGGGSNDTGSTSSSDGTSGTSGSDGTSGGTSGADGTSGGDDAASDTSGSTSGDTSGTTFSCDEVPTESKAGQNCAQPSECDSQFCVADEGGTQGVCRQPCVVNTCTDMCATGEVCLQAGDQSGNPILIPGTTDKYVGFCAIPPDSCTDIIKIATQVDQECSQANNTCEPNASACIITQQGATTGNCKQLCAPGKCTDMCTAGKTCQPVGQTFPDGSPVGACVP